MTAELERRIRELERRYAAMDARRTHVWRNAPALDIDEDSGAPADAQYVTMALNGNLSAERVLTAGTGVSITDGGANGNVTIAATSLIASLVPNGLVRGFGWWLPAGTNTADLAAHGMQKTTISGTISHPALSTATYRESIRRWRYAIASGAGATNTTVVGWTSGSDVGRPFLRGDAAGIGGFFVAFLGISLDLTSGSRCMEGLLGGTSNGPLTTNEPSTMLNCVALAADSGDTNLQIMHNDGSGTCTKIDLGIAKSGIADRVYDLFFFCEPNDSEIRYLLRRRDTSESDITGTITTNLPPDNDPMGVFTYIRYPGGSVAAISFECRGIYGEWGVGQGVEHYGYFA